MKKFTVGQRVRVTSDWCAANVGMVGTIVVDVTCDYGIKFDKKFIGGHNLCGKCTDGYGHWIPEAYLELIEDNYTTKYKPGDTVKVKSDLRKKYYCMTDGSNHMIPTEQMFTKAGKTVKIKSVTKTGKYMIEGSIFPWVDEMFEDKPVTGYCGKTVFIDKGGFSKCGFTVGKIYEFVDGKTKDDEGDYRPIGKTIESLDDIWAKCQFIEIVE